MVALERKENIYERHLQQQKSYGGFRVFFSTLGRFIYNSRNLMVALEYRSNSRSKYIYNSRNLMVALELLICVEHLSSTTVEILWWLQSKNRRESANRSTTVEILWWLQRYHCYLWITDLQQQKSYGGFRVFIISFCYRIYNSRNLMVALEIFHTAVHFESTTVEILWWLQRSSH